MKFLLILALFGSIYCDDKQDNPVYDAYIKAEADIYHLDSTTFDKIKTGEWLVFFGASWCGHCQRFTPDWLTLQKSSSDSTMRLAKVECTKSEDVCESMALAGYPTLIHFKDGVKSEYSGSRDLKDLEAFIKNDVKKTRSVEEETEIAYELLSQYLAQDDIPSSSLNPNGEMIVLTDDSFKESVKTGPWFIKFYAPWCGHCKAMAEDWNTLAGELKNKVNVASVDCTVNKKTCNMYGVQGYPTLIFTQGDYQLPFRESRQVEKMEQFALHQAEMTSFEAIRAKDVSKAIKESDAAFFFVYDYTTTQIEAFKMFHSIVKQLRLPSKMYVSCEPASLSSLSSVKTLPSLILSKDGGQDKTLYTGSLTNNEESRGPLRKWIMNQKYELVPHMDLSNHKELFDSHSYIVLGIFETTSDSKGKKPLAALRSAAKAFKDQEDIQFTYLNALTYKGYLESVFKVKLDDVPRVIVIKPQDDLYYDVSLDGDLFEISAKGIQDALQDALNGSLPAKSTRGTVFGILKRAYKAIEFVKDLVMGNPLTSVFVLLAVSYWIYRVLSMSGYNAVPVKIE